jgi:hypothetical protein
VLVRVCAVVAIALAALGGVGSTNASASNCSLRTTTLRIGPTNTVFGQRLIRAQLQADHASTQRGRVGQLLAIQAVGLRIRMFQSVGKPTFMDTYLEFRRVLQAALRYLGPIRC